MMRPQGSNADEWHLFLCERLDNRASHPNALTFVAVQIAEAIDARNNAISAILADPHGCVFCDSGKLRNPTKDHTPECGYSLARALSAGKSPE